MKLRPPISTRTYTLCPYTTLVRLKLAESTGSMGLCVFARSDDPVYYLAVRAFVGAPARFEDAASGAANATLAAWLASQDALPSPDGHYRIKIGRAHV